MLAAPHTRAAPAVRRVCFRSLESRLAVGQLPRFAAGRALTWSRGSWPGARSPAHARGAPFSDRRRCAINTVCSCAGRGHREWSLRPCPKPLAPAPSWHAKAWHATPDASGRRRRRLAGRARTRALGSPAAARFTKLSARKSTANRTSRELPVTTGGERPVPAIRPQPRYRSLVSARPGQPAANASPGPKQSSTRAVPLSRWIEGAISRMCYFLEISPIRHLP